MPTNRRRRARHRRRGSGLTDGQQMHLLCGHDFFGDGGEPFADEAERRRAWFAHRAEVLAQAWPGRRPLAFWQYEQGYGNDGAWPGGACSESEAVHRLPGTSADEKAAIERAWLRDLGVALGNGRGLAAATEQAEAFHGVPRWFSAEHAPAIQRRLEAQRRAFWEGLTPPPTGGDRDRDGGDER